MQNGIRALYVDDEPGLLELAKIFLENDGGFQVRTCTSATKVIDVPLDQSYDAVVSDYEMPGMDGIAFLKFVREKYGDLPFILFTGRGREEVAIDAINNGANFYIQKGGSAQAQFAELAHKIRQAVHQRRAQAELRKAYERITVSEKELARSEEMVQESEAKFHDLADRLPQMVFETDLDLRITYVNKHTVTAYGFPSEALTSGVSVLSLIHPSQHATFLDSVNNLRNGIPFEPKEYIAFNLDKKPFPVTVYSSPIFRNKQLVGFRGVAVDISDRKRAEEALRESEEKYRILVEVNQDIVYAVEPDGTILYVSPQTFSQLGYRPEEKEGRQILEFIHPEDRSILARYLTADSPSGSPLPQDKFRVLRKDGTYRWYEDKSITTTDHQGRKVIIGSLRDITDRKHAEDAAFESRQMLQSVLDTIPQRVFWKDRDLKFLGCNKSLANDVGYSDPAEMVGKTDYDHASAAIAEHFRADDREVMENDRPKINFEETQIRADGSRAWLRTSKVPLRNRDGEIIGVLGTYEDITEQKKMHEALVESEARFRDLADRLPQMVFETDRDLRVTYANRNAVAVSGISAGDLVRGISILSLIDPACHATFRESVRNLLDNVPFEPKEYTAVTKDGRTLPVIVYSSPIYKNGEIAGFRGIAVDISGWKKMENGIRVSEEKFRSLVENANDIVFSLDRSGNFQYISPQWKDILGHDPHDLIGSCSALLIHPEDSPKNVEAFRQVMETGNKINGLEYRIRHKDGTWRWHSQSAAPVRNASGSIVAYQGICRDITERKRAEDALRESEAQYRLFADNVKDMIWTADLDMHLTYVSPSVTELRGFTPEEALAQSAGEALVPESLAIIREQNRKGKESLRTGGPHPEIRAMELEFYKKDGSTVWTETLVSPTAGPDGSPRGVVGISRDITQRRAAEHALRESENKFATIFRSSQVGLTLLSLTDETFFDVNETFVKYTGYSREDVIGKSPLDLGLLAEAGASDPIISSLRSGGNFSDRETRFRIKSGEVRTCLVSANIITMGGEAYVLSSVVDITGRRKAEAALRESEGKFRTFVENASEIVFMIRPDGIYSYISPNVKELAGYEVAEVFGKPAEAFIHPGDYPHLREIFRESIASGKKMSGVAFRMQHKDGTWHWLSLSISPVRDVAGTVIAMQGICYDVTDQKRTEGALRQANRKLNLLSGITRHDINNQLVALDGLVELLKNKSADPSTAGYFSRITSTIEEITRLIQFTREYEEIGVQTPKWQELRPLADKAGSGDGRATLINDLLPGMEVYADPLIAKVFSNLVDNALRHGDTVTKIRFFCREENGDRIIVCEDDGKGVAAGEKKKIFDPGFGKNTGFGLALSREILDITGITIAENGMPGKGARFEITVPAGQFRATR